MKTGPMSKALQFWDRTAGSYDQEERKEDNTYRLIIEQLDRYLKPTDTVLDLGCGTGRVCNEISGKVTAVHAIDFSSKMIGLAEAKARKQGIQNIRYLQATIVDDRLRPASYDVILSLYVLHLLEDPEEVLLSIQQLLKPGGIFISVTPCMGERKTLRGGLCALLGTLGITPRFTFFKSHELSALLTKGGFKLIEHHFLAATSNEYFIVTTYGPDKA
jgi:2-polyprenyl-3-methyl-5-hydroxy-6-metoxy-1,4-benzoquinol methylase